MRKNTGKNGQRAVPEGHMTVGQLAKRMNVTVRTLQYYDRQGLLSPSAESEGGRRLYTDKDMVQLHQILSLKYLGFSLEDIKTRLIPLENPEQVAQLLQEQAELTQAKIDGLSDALYAIRTLREEILQMQTVDFKKYADIVALLRMKNEHYWVAKHFDDRLMDHISHRFNEQTGTAMINTWKTLCDESIELQRQGVSAQSERGQELARRWWEMVMQFTGGDMSLLPHLMNFYKSRESWNESWREKQNRADQFLTQALETYLLTLEKNPFEEDTK